MSLEKHAAGIGALADPVRRALYEHIVRLHEAVGREAAAEAVGVPVHTAKFHLERLVEEGLLETEFRRLSGRTGPGAGRPAKLYRRASTEIRVSLPERRYDLAGSLLADAISRAAQGEPLEAAIEASAREAGVEHGQAVASGSPVSDPAERMSASLEKLGYEPHYEGGSIRLENCPFDSLAQNHTALVCGMNRDYVQGVADGLGCAGARAELDPRAGSCCVRIDLADKREAGKTDAIE